MHRAVLLTGAFVLFLLPGLAEGAEGGGPIHIRVHAKERHSIDPRLFGQFLERPSWGETGPEAAAAKDGSLPKKIVTALQKMSIPVLRFPGGTDVDFTDWTDMISNAPGRAAERPVTTGHKGHKVTNRFGFDEYFRLRKKLGCDTILVVNLLDALAKRKPKKVAAQHAAGLVAYANAPQGAKLPKGMPNWPAVRAKNGHPAPYNVRIFQLGNEWWCGGFPEAAKKGAGGKDLVAWYRECILAYADAMQAVDPSVEIMIDGKMDRSLAKKLLPDPQIRRRIKYVAYHMYAPGKMGKPKLKGKVVEPGSLSPRAWWLALSSVPGSYDDRGCNIALGERIATARASGYLIAATEWNWNDWGGVRAMRAPLGFEWRHAAAIGVAGFLNGLIRQGKSVRIANQSMLLGHSWNIAAIRFDRNGKAPLRLGAQGMVTTFYNLRHGDRVLNVEVTGAPLVEQPYSIGWYGPVKKIALLDVVATRGPEAVFVHVVNRSFDRDLAASVDLKALGVPDGKAIVHVLQGVPKEKVPASGAWMRESSKPAEITAGLARFTFPRRTVSILVVPLKPGGKFKKSS